MDGWGQVSDVAGVPVLQQRSCSRVGRLFLRLGWSDGAAASSAVPGRYLPRSARGNERSPIYCDDGDRHRFLELLAHVRERYRWRILAYCLMTNHYHLLVQTPEPHLARGMRQLNGVYAQWFNRRHRRVGHLFQGRYGARLMQADEHLLAAVRYIVRNPVRAGLCRDPEEWRWSSHRATLGSEPPWFLDTPALLAHYGPTATAARERYGAHCREEGERERTDHPLIYGDEGFVVATLERVEPAPGVPRRYLQTPRPQLADLLASADIASAAAAHAHGYPLRQIARHLDIHVSTLSRRLRRHCSPPMTATTGT